MSEICEILFDFQLIKSTQIQDKYQNCDYVKNKNNTGGMDQKSYMDFYGLTEMDFMDELDYLDEPHNPFL